MHSTHPFICHTVRLKEAVQIQERLESEETNENYKKTHTMPTVVLRSADSFATLFLQLLFTMIKVILLYLTSV